MFSLRACTSLQPLFESFLLICPSFVVRTRGIVLFTYRLANYEDPCKRSVLALFQSRIFLDKIYGENQKTLRGVILEARKADQTNGTVRIFFSVPVLILLL